MPELIDRESKQAITYPINLDYFTNRYKTTNQYFIFSSPVLWTIDKNLYYLLRNSEEKTFETKYKMRPDYLSFDEYGTTILGQVLMYVNGVFCIEDFDLDKVYIPTLKSISDILQDKIPSQTVDNVIEVNW